MSSPLALQAMHLHDQHLDNSSPSGVTRTRPCDSTPSFTCASMPHATMILHIALKHERRASLTSPYLRLSRKSPCQQENRWCAIRAPAIEQILAQWYPHAAHCSTVLAKQHRQTLAAEIHGHMPEVATMKLDPIHSACAKHHRACPKDCGCRVILMTPVSHMCNLGLSTAAT